MNEFFTWQFLASFTGAVTGTAIVTQFLKNIFAKLPTQILSYIIAVIILAGATAALNTAASGGWTAWAIIPLNGILVSLSANGAYSGIRRISGNTGDAGDKEKE